MLRTCASRPMEVSLLLLCAAFSGCQTRPSGNPDDAAQRRLARCGATSVDTSGWLRVQMRDGRMSILLPPGMEDLPVVEGQTWRTDAYLVHYRVSRPSPKRDTILADEVLCQESVGPDVARVLMRSRPEGLQLSASWGIGPEAEVQIAGDAADSTSRPLLMTVLRSIRTVRP